MAEGDEVRTDVHVIDRETGGDWPVDMVGTLMDDLGDGDWMVYVPGHGGVVVNERDM